MFELDSIKLMQCLVTCLSGGLGTFLLMPHARQAVKSSTIFAVGLGLIFFATIHVLLIGGSPEPIVSKIFFNVFGFFAVVAAALMITARDPVHSALWFAVVVLCTSGLFLLAGASFLAAGTVIVYAGAVIVTFLFVIMLAQSEGRALYDRLARQPAQATLTGFIMIWALLIVVASDPGNTYEKVAGKEPSKMTTRLVPARDLIDVRKIMPEYPAAKVMAQTLTPELSLPDTMKSTLPPGVPEPHVAGLGAAMYTTHLISSELVGAILFVALAGAVIIATPRIGAAQGG